MTAMMTVAPAMGCLFRHGRLSSRRLGSSPTFLLPDVTLTLLTRKINIPPLLKGSMQTLRMPSQLKRHAFNRTTVTSNAGRISFRNLFSTTRCHAGVRKKLPFEVNTNVSSDTTLFTYSNDRFFRTISIFGVAQVIFWGQLGLFSYSTLDSLQTEEGQSRIEADTFWGKVIMLQSTYKTRIAALCVTVGTIVLFFTLIYPQRAIRQLTLLKGGQNLEVTTYTHFGRSRSFVVPMDHLSVQAPRSGKSSQVSLKLKGHWFFYLMDKREGKFHNTDLFDFAVGLKRNLK